MKIFILLILFCPLLSIAQSLPRYKHDTVYTSSGYKIYKGQTLRFGNPTGRFGRFKYIKIKNGMPSRSLTNNPVVIKKLKNYGISILGNGYIEIIGRFKYSDGSTGYVDIHMAFDRAIENSLYLESELIVPMEFRNIPDLYPNRTEEEEE